MESPYIMGISYKYNDGLVSSGLQSKILIIVLLLTLVVGVNIINSKFKMQSQDNYSLCILQDQKRSTETLLNTAKNAISKKLDYQIQRKKRKCTKTVTFKMNKDDLPLVEIYYFQKEDVL